MEIIESVNVDNPDVVKTGAVGVAECLGEVGRLTGVSADGFRYTDLWRRAENWVNW